MDFNNGSPAGALNGTYSLWDTSVVTYAYPEPYLSFDLGDRIHYSFTQFSSPAAYASIILRNFYSSLAYETNSVANVQSAQSGTITITDGDVSPEIRVSSRPLDSNGNQIGSDASRLYASVNVLISCTPAGSTPTPYLTNLSISAGPEAGGNSVTISGNNLSGATSVKFGNTEAVSITSNTATQIVAVAPAGTAGSTVQVTVTTPGGTTATSSATRYTYVAAPTITGLAFNMGAMAGGEGLAIFGTNLLQPRSIKFGTVEAQVYPSSGNSDTRLYVYVPAGVTPGPVDITITTDGGTSVTSANSRYTYRAVPAITSISPSSGPVSGGNTVTITGTDLANIYGITFGGRLPSALALNTATQIVVTVPAGFQTGDADVLVTTVGGTSTAGPAARYTYLAAPVITAVSPSSGSTAGGTSVTITGTALDGATSVQFGGVEASSITSNTATQIVAVAPAGSAGARDVRITTPGGTVTSTGAFTYIAPNPPIAGSLATVVDQDSSNNAINLPLSGGAASSVSLGTAPSHGTATVSGTSVTYTPDAGYYGTDTFTYTASNGDGTSAPGLVTVNVLRSLTLITTSIAPPQLGTPYNQTLSVAGGTSVYGFSAYYTGAAGDLSVDPDTGAITGTPVTVGSFDLTVNVLDRVSSQTVSRLFSFVVAPPSINLSPATQALADGTLGAPYSQTLSASGGIGPYAFTLTGGTLPAGLTLSSSGTLSGTPTQTGDVSFTVEARDLTTRTAGSAETYAGSRTYTLTVSPPAPVVTSVSPAMGPVAGGTSVTITGTSLAGATAVKFGSIDAAIVSNSDTAIVAVAPAGVASTVDVTVTTGVGTSAVSANDQFTYLDAPTIGSVAPSSGPQAGGTSVVIAGTGLANVQSVLFGSVPAAAFTVDSATQITATTPAQAPGSTDVTVRTVGGDVTLTNGFTFLPPASTDASLAALTLNGAAFSPGFSPGVTSYVSSVPNGVASVNVTATVAEAHASVAINGTVVASGAASGVIPLFVGDNAITIVVTAQDGVTTRTYSLTINRAAPVLPVLAAVSPSSGPAAGGTPVVLTGTGLSNVNSVTFDGQAASSFTVLSATTINAVAPPHAAGTVTVEVSAPAGNATLSDAFTYLTVPVPVNFAFMPPAGPLPDAMAGEEYSEQITATGGSGARRYRLLSGTLPAGLSLDAGTGTLTGPLAADAAARTYAFTVQVTDAAGATGSVAYRLRVKPRAITIINRVVIVAPGSTPPAVWLNEGATGGPFTSANVAFVEPANAGEVEITSSGGDGQIHLRSQRGSAAAASAARNWYLHFTPDPAYSGDVRIGYQLGSALGTSSTGTITYRVSADKAEVAESIDMLVHDFVLTRQNLVAGTLKVPGLIERRQMEQASDPVTARMMPSENGLTAHVSTSLAELEAARDKADGIENPGSDPLNIWLDGNFLVHNDKDINGSRWGGFAMLSTGVDYLVNDSLLLGFSLHMDRTTDPTDEDGELSGNGWLAGPYASVEIGRNVFLNASALYGGSSNSIDTPFWDGSFDTSRILLDTSIEGQWTLGDDIVLTPKLRALYFRESVDDYTVGDSTGDTIDMPGFDAEQFRVSLGAEIARSFTLPDGSTVTPSASVTGGVSALDGTGAFGSLKFGVTLQTVDFWMLDAGLLLDIDASGRRAVGGKLGVSKSF